VGAYAASCRRWRAAGVDHAAEHRRPTAGKNPVTTSSTSCNEVTRRGRALGGWSAGGASSLKLLDPNSTAGLAANWGTAMRAQKSSGRNIECTGVLDKAGILIRHQTYAADRAAGCGECLVDNIEWIGDDQLCGQSEV